MKCHIGCETCISFRFANPEVHMVRHSGFWVKPKRDGLTALVHVATAGRHFKLDGILSVGSALFIIGEYGDAKSALSN